ncbi:MAG: helix-turn-helix domain-containing protein [Clostridia bacterium]|nr:helix-turn-helix domain-containing protein [Clostridia bacterium]
MEEKVFKSSLTKEEIEANFKNADLFSGIMSGLEEALAYEKGTAKAATIARKRSLPDINVSETRKALNMTQKAFAGVLGVSARTVEAWESGRTNPSHTARNLIFLISQDYSLVSKLRSQMR